MKVNDENDQQMIAQRELEVELKWIPRRKNEAGKLLDRL
jgi:hypothetical protein